MPTPSVASPDFSPEASIPSTSAAPTVAATTSAELPTAPQVEKLLAEFSAVKQLLQTHLSARAWDDIQAQSTDKAEALRILLNAGF